MRERVVLVAWAAFVVVALIWGRILVARTAANLYVGAVPFFGHWHLALGGHTAVPIAVGAVAVAALPTLLTRAHRSTALVLVAVTAVAFGAALSYAKPPSTAWSSIHDDYGRHVALVGDSPGGFLRDYVAHQPTFPTHLQAHPPGMVLLLAESDRIGLKGAWFENGLALAGAAAAAMATVVLVEALAGVDPARRAAPFVVLAPAAVWHTNADTIYGGVALTGIALIVLGIWRTERRSTAHLVAGGAIFGASLLLSYGLVALAVLPAVVACVRHRPRALLLAAAACAGVLVLPACWGFSWIAGLQATKHQYDLNLARVRPYGYFVVANLAVFAVAIGPSVTVGLARLRDAGTWLVVGSGLASVALADVSGLALAETERIWQPFMPLVLAGGAGLATSGRRAPRGWLALQVAVAVVLVAALRSPW